MNQPAAKRFSLQRLLTTPAAAPLPALVEAAAPVEPDKPGLAAVSEPPTPAPAAPVAAAEPPPAFRDLGPASKPPLRQTAGLEAESHPKKKRSYSVDMKLCEDLEVLSWYQGRSSSSVVEELMRKHLQHNRALVAKAREIRSAR